MRKLLLIACLALPILSARIAPAGESAPVRAPEFAALTAAGEKVTLRQYTGKVVLISFFASWCKPCRSEAPVLNGLAKDFPGSLQVLAVGYQETDPAALQKTGAEFGLEVPLIVDAQGTIAVGYKVTGLPTSVLVDEFGYVAKQYKGITEASVADLRRLIERRAKAIEDRKKKGLAVFVSPLTDGDERARAGHTGAGVAGAIRAGLTEGGVKLADKAEDATLLLSGNVSDLGAVVGAEVVVSEPEGKRELARVRGSIVGGNSAPLVKNTLQAVKDWTP